MTSKLYDNAVAGVNTAGLKQFKRIAKIIELTATIPLVVDCFAGVVIFIWDNSI